MNDVDELIKQELGEGNENLDGLLHPRPGMLGMAMDAFSGSMGRWVWLMSIGNVIAAGFMFWIGYRFVIAADVDTRLYWGIWLVVAVIFGTAMKYWTWMEMNRTSIQKEISRLELAVLSLKGSLNK